MITTTNKTGFKMTEIGFIPEDWEVRKIGEIADVIGGGTPSTNVSCFWNGSIEWFTPTEIGISKYVYTSKRKITDDGFKNSSAKILNEGTILLTSRAGIGDLAILKKKACTNQGFQSLSPKKDTDSEYIYYLMLTKKNSLLEKASGSTFLEISPNSVRSILIQFPSKKEQQLIAKTLSDTDELITSLYELIDKKQKIKEGAMQELLTGKKRLPGFSGEWEEKKLGEICEIKKGQLITANTCIFGNIPVIAGGKTPAYYHNKFNRKANVITISASGANAGFVAFHNYPIFASDCSTIEENINYSIYFIFNYLQLLQDKIYKLQTGGAQPHIHPSDINPIKLKIPKDIKEQQAIAQVLSDMNSEIESLEQKRDKYKQIKEGMMQELLTGKIRLI